jgi:DNA-directed RNA polymerase specialized sigma24 family protein
MENSYEEIAQLLGKPSADAARMAVHRALVRLAEEMKRGG